jgi:hypothetical protein
VGASAGRWVFGIRATRLAGPRSCTSACSFGRYLLQTSMLEGSDTRVAVPSGSPGGSGLNGVSPGWPAGGDVAE